MVTVSNNMGLGQNISTMHSLKLAKQEYVTHKCIIFQNIWPNFAQTFVCLQRKMFSAKFKPSVLYLMVAGKAAASGNQTNYSLAGQYQGYQGP
jgi:hypothetical protein